MQLQAWPTTSLKQIQGSPALEQDDDIFIEVECIIAQMKDS